MIQPFSYYDHIIISYSGGKDSTACLILADRYNVPKEKIWLWHQAIDGREETETPFFDWPSTEGYTRKVAEQFNIQIDYQWRHHGLHGEMFRNNSRTNDVSFTHNNSTLHLPTKGGKESTRLKWPAKTASLNTRWCSAYLKIDVAARALANHPLLKDKRILFITGERRQESAARAKYKEAELHRTNSKSRLVHHWRPIIDWNENRVWEAMEEYRVKPHPAYYLGFPRLSCRSCIFYSKDHWATLNHISPEVTARIAQIEHELGFTIDNKFTVNELIRKGESLILPENINYIKEATTQYNQSVSMPEWILPTGAFGSGGGSI